MRNAAKLLVDTDQQINMIAKNVGFRNLRTFDRAFYTFYNTSPSDFRKSPNKDLIPPLTEELIANLLESYKS
jgi:transcriptional regulator GlxA family with amidase domain